VPGVGGFRIQEDICANVVGHEPDRVLGVCVGLRENILGKFPKIPIDLAARVDIIKN